VNYPDATLPPRHRRQRSGAAFQPGADVKYGRVARAARAHGEENLPLDAGGETHLKRSCLPP
jgi:hypothetical protein